MLQPASTVNFSLCVLLPGTALAVVFACGVHAQEAVAATSAPPPVPPPPAPAAPVRAAVPDARQDSIAASAGEFVSPLIFWTKEQSPADFLEMAGKHTRARWRTLYRPRPPIPSADRTKAAFTLGSLIGETFLIREAGDSQQFRNNNQDIVTYCRLLGLTEKMKPRLMAQAKMAEMDEWTELRQEIVDGHKELMRALRDQKDEDLATLVDIGAWMRSLEVVSKLVVEIPDVDKRHLCIGSPALLSRLRQDFASLSEPTRRSNHIQPVFTVLTGLEKVWNNKTLGPPTQSMVAGTHEQLREVMENLTLK